VEQIAGWIAPAATMIASTMTASNLGPRTTGWGFAVFLIGSAAWVVVALGTGQSNLLWTNVFLGVVNAMGVWRWLGRQARYEDGSKAAETESALRSVPNLFSATALAGRKVVGPRGEPLGSLVDGMLRCSDNRLEYVVLRCGGVGGVGEELHALSPDEISFSDEAVTCRFDGEALSRSRTLPPDQWPGSLDAWES
jgi:hypothetical protein